MVKAEDVSKGGIILAASKEKPEIAEIFSHATLESTVKITFTCYK